MQPGLMQNAPLLISSIVTHAARAHGDREIVSRLVDEPLWRYDYAGLANRAAQAASMLRALGIGPGDCVSSLAWNTHRHYELFFAVPGLKAETAQIAFDLAGVSLSAGSACSSGKVGASHVLKAMGATAGAAGDQGALRVSIGRATGEAELAAFRAAFAGMMERRAAREKAA